MDLSKPISYNGITASGSLTPSPGIPQSGYQFEEIDVSTEEVAAYLDKRALADGVDASDVYLGRRTAKAILSVYGSTKGDLWDKTQNALAAFSPTLAYNADSANLGFLAFDFYQPTGDIVTWPTSTYPNGIPLRFYLRPESTPGYTSQRDTQGGAAARGGSKQLRLVLVARDPRKYLQTTTTVSLSTSTQTATYRGDYPTFPIITLTTTAAGSSSFTLTIGGSAIVYDLSGASAGTYTIDYGKKSIVDGSGARADSLFSAVTQFRVIQSGTTYRMSNTTGVSACSMTYREAFA